MDVVWVRTQHLLAWRCRTPPSPMTTRLSFDGERADVSNQRKNESKARTLVMPVKKRRHGTQYLCPRYAVSVRRSPNVRASCDVGRGWERVATELGRMRMSKTPWTVEGQRIYVRWRFVRCWQTSVKWCGGVDSWADADVGRGTWDADERRKKGSGEGFPPSSHRPPNTACHMRSRGWQNIQRAFLVGLLRKSHSEDALGAGRGTVDGWKWWSKVSS